MNLPLRLIAPLLGAGVLSVSNAFAATVDLYLGTYTKKGSQGIYRSTFDPKSGATTAPTLAATMADPSFVLLSTDGQNLYAVSESGAMVAAFRREANGSLTKLNELPTGGAAPCHLVIAGRTLLVANYNGGSIVAFRLEANGSLGAQTSFFQHTGHSVHARQNMPHAHGFALSPDNRQVFVADLGLDRVKSYRLNPATGVLELDTAHDVILPAGSGPRHLAFSPDAKHLYCLNEIGNTLAAFTYDASTGALKAGPIHSTLPENFADPTTTAEVAVHPNGRFVYVSNRGHDSLAAFEIASGEKPLLRTGIFASGGKHPRHFMITSDGRWLLVANRDSDNVVVFSIDGTTGYLKPLAQPLTLSQPVCVAMAAPR